MARMIYFTFGSEREVVILLLVNILKLGLSEIFLLQGTYSEGNVGPTVILSPEASSYIQLHVLLQ